MQNLGKFCLQQSDERTNVYKIRNVVNTYLNVTFGELKVRHGMSVLCNALDIMMTDMQCHKNNKKHIILTTTKHIKACKISEQKVLKV